jgi:hypothetical protein
MSSRSLGLVTSLICVIGFASSAHSLTIDSFTVSQELSGPNAVGFPRQSTVLGDMLGGEREMVVGGPTPADAVTGIVGGGSLSLVRSTAGQHFVDLSWETDGIDLTEGGATSAFLLDVGLFTGLTSIGISASTDLFGSMYSQYSRVLESPGVIEAAFTDFQSLGEGGPVDFTDVRLITLRIQTTGEARLDGGLLTVPEPGTGLLLLSGLIVLARSHRPTSRYPRMG